MKAFFAFALLAVVCAAAENDPYVEPVRIVEVPDLGYIPNDNLRVHIVDSPADNYGFEPLAPSELENPLVNEEPQQNAYPFRPLADPMWR